MRRRTGHVVFAAAALLCAAVIVIQEVRLQHAISINQAIAASDRGIARPPGDVPTGDRRIVLAQAAALARAGNADAALRSFNALLAPGLMDDVARAALFDSGNLYLRQGLRATGNAAVFMPMLESAKQRYRDLLRADPSDWDARFNLERALRAAPEDAEAFDQPDDRPLERPPNKMPELLAPDLP